ncbi:RING finger domain-containing protein [Giardia duodenalis]|uniref:RING finger domain-containing protein n=1 Tax=Giardia intestinalis (strain ATCC 50803 / WB clone C6) TaxID=184922 RepID=A8BL62_GIAIC|nr:RING finger domain-containing protein [Giardia intestinalis]KAE8301561.1 RING finger domain-containing protein [Giardia intestinalis]|eukprot:XP_001706429.1 Hypothetical protein GL50803_9850 [Giardia lamblia ATCC 50803]
MRSNSAVLALVDALRCIVCHDVARKPVVLGCDHIFCLECIRSIPPDTDNALMYRCPLCSAPYSLQRCQPNARLDLISMNFLVLLETVFKAPSAISPVRQATPDRASFITASSFISISDEDPPVVYQKPPSLSRGTHDAAEQPVVKRRPPAIPRKARCAARGKAQAGDFDSLAYIPLSEFCRGDAVMQRLETLRACDWLLRFGFSSTFVSDLRSGASGIRAIKLYNEYLRRYKHLRSDPTLAQNPDLRLYVTDIVLRTEASATVPDPQAASDTAMYATLLKELLGRRDACSRLLRKTAKGLGIYFNQT